MINLSNNFGSMKRQNASNILARNIKRLRRSKGWSQEDLAYFANLSRNFISLLESSKKNPSITTIELLAKLFDVKLEEFFKD